MDTTADEKLSIPEACKRVPKRNGKYIHYSAVHRWIVKGVNGVKLPAWKFGKQFYTSQRALDEFASKLAQVERTPRTRTPKPILGGRVRTPEQRAAAVAQAEAALDAAGV